MPPELMGTSLSRIVAHIAKWATDTPDRPAVTVRNGTIIFGQLWRDSGSSAALLIRHGVRAGDALGHSDPSGPRQGQEAGPGVIKSFP